MSITYRLSAHMIVAEFTDSDIAILLGNTLQYYF
jgi:hypothetical protein